ncbi:MAG: PRC-barrel domain-containing protein [Peptococcaceae bacterium]|nr:PRC-barrel domain-containing protein [Peptococcaceae bacterium]
MKKSREIINLPIVGIAEGTRVGRVKAMVVNPARKKVQYVTAEVSDSPGEVLVLPFERVVGVGEHALTIDSRSAMESVVNFPDVVDLLMKNVQVTGLRVLDTKGTLQGTVSEYVVDTDNGGAIAGCFLTGQASGLIPASAIITYSPAYLIVSDGFPLLEDGKLPPETPQPSAVAPPEAKAPENGFSAFVGKQREFLTGRTVTADIVDAEGTIVAREGEVVTEDLIEKVIAADKYIELTISTR